MAVLRSVIDLALDELVSNWEGMRFLSAAMVYANPRRCSGSGILRASVGSAPTHSTGTTTHLGRQAEAEDADLLWQALYDGS